MSKPGNIKTYYKGIKVDDLNSNINGTDKELSEKWRRDLYLEHHLPGMPKGEIPEEWFNNDTDPKDEPGLHNRLKISDKFWNPVPWELTASIPHIHYPANYNLEATNPTQLVVPKVDLKTGKPDGDKLLQYGWGSHNYDSVHKGICIYHPILMMGLFSGTHERISKADYTIMEIILLQVFK